MDYEQWMGVAAGEYDRLLALLRVLDDTEWPTITDCDPWTVRDVVAHVIGGAEATASFKEQLRQQSKGLIHRDKRGLLTTVNDRQISERGNLSTAQLIAALEDAARRGVENRSRIPALVQRINLPLPAPVGWESWGYLNSKIYTRDTWMHRIDISQATGRALELSADDDGLIVADLVNDWSKGKMPGLILTGQAGGIFGSGNGPSYDAIDFARAIAGRGTVEGITPDASLF